MATWTDVSRLLRGTEREPGKRVWRVKKKLVAWERPLRKSDLEALGDAAPTGDILGVYVPIELKDALVEQGAPYFTTPHFNGYPAILVELARAKVPELKKLLATACAERSVTKRRARRP